MTITWAMQVHSYMHSVWIFADLIELAKIPTWINYNTLKPYNSTYVLL